MKGRRLAFIAIVLLQIGFLVFMIAGKQYTLASGEKILLKTQPIDPRSLFSGDYVRLAYEISQIDLSKVETDIDYSKDGRYLENRRERIKASSRVYVKLSKKPGDEYWTPVSVTLKKPETGPGEVFIKGKRHYIDARGDTHVMMVSYGIETFYVPEGRGLEIERKINAEDTTFVEVSIDRSGNAVITDLIQDGKPVRFD